MQASFNPFSLFGNVGLRMATRSGFGSALLQMAWAHRHVVVRRITLTSAVVALILCAATWRLSSMHLTHSGRDILATKNYATSRTDIYTHVHPRLRMQGETAVVARIPLYRRPVVRSTARVYVRASDYWAHEIASWLNPIAFWGMLLTPVLLVERLWARRRAQIRTPSTAPPQSQMAPLPFAATAIQAIDNRARQSRRAQFLPTSTRPLRTAGQSSRLNQSLFGR